MRSLLFLSLVTGGTACGVSLWSSSTSESSSEEFPSLLSLEKSKASPSSWDAAFSTEIELVWLEVAGGITPDSVIKGADPSGGVFFSSAEIVLMVFSASIGVSEPSSLV